ncbi:MAG TPA: DUF2069 domain-containing protein [Rudaea sp.]|nr:DUF2069 domain-containing protein [Rudaea sp.]
MSTASSSTLRFGLAALVALLAFELAWHAGFAAAPGTRFWPTLALATLPLVPALWIARANLRRGVLVGGIVCLFYFSHGVSALYGDSGVRAAAGVEIALATAVIAVLGWDARGYRRAKTKPAQPG